MSNAFSRLLRNDSAKSARNKARAKKRLAPRSLHLDSLEKREMFSVSSLAFSGTTLVVKADNSATSVAVSKVGSDIRITDVGSGKTWDYATTKVGKVEFQGGSKNDTFLNKVSNLPIRAFGNGGNDSLTGGGADDYLNGGSGNDVLIGNSGDDDLIGGADNDRLIGGAGTDRHWGEAGNDVIISIDAAYNDYVEGGAGTDTLWIDKVGSSRDRLYGNLASELQEVGSFANGADRTLNGDRIADPKQLSGHTTRQFSGNPLFASDGPEMDDVKQGALGDCYALAGLGAIAEDNPQAIRHNVVDFGDGTYGVRLGDKFYRVDDDLPVKDKNSSTPAYAKLGDENSMWVAVTEKAFAHYRKGQNSYASIESGQANEMNKAFRSTSASSKGIKDYGSATAFAKDVDSRLSSGQAVTLGIHGDGKGKKEAAGGVPLVTGHAYTVVSVKKNSAGTVTSITVRNPWGHNNDFKGQKGVDGALVTLTPSQFYAQAGTLFWGRV